MKIPGANKAGRWQLALKVLPLVIGIGAAKVVVNLLGWDQLEVNPLLTGLLAANVFVLGFLLAGTLADYKESERLPSELTASLASIADECRILHQDKAAPAASQCLDQLSVIAGGTLEWLHRRRTTSELLAEVAALNDSFLAFEPLTQPNFIVRLKQEQSAARRVLLRIHTIRDTSFVGPGYAIAELASGFLIAGLLFVQIDKLAESLFFVCLIAFLLIYMIMLIKDLDDPFDYRPEEAGGGEVSLHALDHLREELAASAAQMTSGPPA